MKKPPFGRPAEAYSTVLTVALTLLVATGCGKKDKKDDNSSSEATPEEADAIPARVRVCHVALPSPAPAASPAPSEAAAFALAASVTYSGDLYPLMQTACAQCHRGDIENRQNSTNCFYMRDHIDNLITRLENGVAAAAYKAANPTATDNDINAMYPQGERPMPPINRQPLSTTQIDLFKAWRLEPNKCEEGDAGPADPTIAQPTEYSSDSDETSHESLEKIFDNASCEDGPDVNTDENWTRVAPLLEQEANPASAFYDYSAKAYLDGATAAPFTCDYDHLISSLGDLSGVEETLRPYEKYNWKLTQCAVVDGLPVASLVTLSRTTNTLGDKIIGINFKKITIETQSK